MKNNPFFLAVAIALGLSIGAYIPPSKFSYLFFNIILRGIR